MAIKTIVRKSVSRGSESWHEKFSVPAGEIGDTYIIPDINILEIGISWDIGTPGIYFTFDSREDIESISAHWVQWDLESRINRAVTGFYMDNSGGGSAVEFVINIRAEEIST